MQDYSLGLALFDYIPVLLSALGLGLLARQIGQALPGSRPWVWIGVALVLGGGLSKASWKLIWVLQAVDVVLLNNLLFILMAPGMLILAFHTAAACRIWQGAEPGHALAPALILGALALAGAAFAAGGGGKTWFFILLGTASLANISMSTLLIRFSWKQNERLTASVFLFSILVILSLSGLARISEGSAPLQWLAECLNALAHGSFALAVWRLQRSILSRPASV